jgi:hypothetical protein
MGTDLVTLIFDPRVPLLQLEYLHKGTFLETKILGVVSVGDDTCRR